jgi:hypothetical protein
MKDPGLRSLQAKSPYWPCAGWEGDVMGVIFTSGQGPLGVLGGMSWVSLGRVRRLERWAALRA